MKGLPINDEIHYILHNINICLTHIIFNFLKLTTQAFLIYESWPIWWVLSDAFSAYKVWFDKFWLNFTKDYIIYIV